MTHFSLNCLPNIFSSSTDLFSSFITIIIYLGIYFQESLPMIKHVPLRFEKSFFGLALGSNDPTSKQQILLTMLDIVSQTDKCELSTES